MDGSRFDYFTVALSEDLSRRGVGPVALGFAASVLAALGIGADSGIDARRRRRRKKKRRKKRQRRGAAFCTGKNHCAVEGTCHAPSSEVQCFCFVTVNGDPFCSIGAVITDCVNCTAGETCVFLTGGRCGDLPTGCAKPCPDPL
jgi:hypothetical protein